MECCYYKQKQCLSCQWLDKSYTKQLADKQHILINKLAPFQIPAIYEPIASSVEGFRNKAKMVVTGTVEKPILGIINHQNEPLDLCECPLYPQPLQQALIKIRQYIKLAGLAPYNINKKKGELKFVIVTYEHSRFMVRFILRSHNRIARIQETLAILQQLIPQIVVISVNIQPKHAAILEGEEEIILTDEQWLPIVVNQIPLFIRPQSFFQTNTLVAAQLYRVAANWVQEIQHQSGHLKHIWDLFCGVGGFGLHCVQSGMRLTGIEISHEAIECAKKSAHLLNLTTTDFRSLDSTEFALTQQDIPDFVLVNPPRRGMGDVLAQYLQQVGPKYILYSSCNIDSLVSDLVILSDYQVIKAQLFDMFPYTAHVETMVLLQQRNMVV